MILTADQAVDSTYVRIAFPQNIKGAKVGYTGEAVLDKSMQAAAFGWELGRNSSGECDIIQASVNIDENVSGTTAANTLTVRTSRLDARTVVMAVVAVGTDDLVMKSNQPIFEGDYENTKWGQTVKRKLRFRDLGMEQESAHCRWCFASGQRLQACDTIPARRMANIQKCPLCDQPADFNFGFLADNSADDAYGGQCLRCGRVRVAEGVVARFRDAKTLHLLSAFFRRNLRPRLS